MKTKNLSTPLKIIKILKLMTEKPVSMEEIILLLEKDNIFVNRETISKYFATLRNSGCDIQKRKNKFYIKYPMLNFTDSEFDTLSIFQKISKNLLSKKDYENFLSFLDKLFTLTDKEEILIYKKILDKTEDKNLIDNGKFKDKIEAISIFLEDTPQKIKITTEKETKNIVPLKFHYLKESVCLFGYDCKDGVNRHFPIDKIIDIKQIPTRASSADFALSTTFKIKGNLKNSYLIKEDEIISPHKDYLIVTNNKEDKDELFKRLLKYGTNCEILYPKSDREKFKNLVETLILKHT